MTRKIPNSKFQDLKKILPTIRKDILLKNYTTFKIGGPARYFFIAKNKEDIIKAVKTAKEFKLPFFILGGGSNILVSDKGFNGLVIKFGQPLSLYVSKGLEWAAGIPGTVQGAVCGNAGAFGKSMKNVVESVEVFDTETEKVKIFKNKNCRFSYRNSIFREKKNLIILSATLQLKKEDKKVIENKIKKNLEQKKRTQPLDFPSAGSIFKNPQGFSAGELIEKSGLKGKKIGDAEISKNHANFIVNLGKAKAKDVLSLMKLAKQKVKNKFGIVLEEEIELL